MIWFIPLVAGAAGSWWVTKETITGVIEADKSPEVVVGTNINTGAVLTIVVLLVIGYFWIHKKGKG